MADKLRLDLELNSQGYVEGAQKASYTTKELKKSTQEYLDSFGPLKKQFRQAKTEAMNLAAQFAALSKAEKESEFGQELKESLDIAIEKAAELQDVMGDTQQAIKNAASDTATWDALKETMEIGKSATLAYAGAVAQLTGNEEDLAKLVKTLTVIENVFNTAIKIGNALQSQSALMTGIRRLQTLAATAAESLSTKAKVKNTAATVANTVAENANKTAKVGSTTATVALTAATGKATVAQKLFNAIANANPYVLLGTAALTVVTAVSGFMFATKKASDEQKEFQEELDKSKTRLESFSSAAGSEYGKLRSSYEHLRDEWNKLKTDHEKNKFLDENKKKINELSSAVNNITSAENFFNNQTATVIKAFELRAKAAAAAALEVEAYKESLQKQVESQSAVNFNGAIIAYSDYTRLDNELKKFVKIEYDEKDRMQYVFRGLTDAQDDLIRKSGFASVQFMREADAAEKRAKYFHELNEELRKEAQELVPYNDNNNNNNNDNNDTKQQTTQYQKLLEVVSDLEKKKENINPLDPKAEEDIKKLNKQIREAQTNADNFKIFIDYELDQKDYAKLQGLTGEINKIKNQIDDLDKTSPDYLNQFDELNNKLKEAENNLSNFKFEVGIEISSKTFDQLQNLSDEIDKYKKEVEDIKLNPDFSDYNNKLKEAEDKLKEVSEKYQNLKVKVDFQIVNDPNKYINQLKDEQKKFEDDYKIAISVGDKDAAENARKAYQNLQKEIDKYELQINNLKAGDAIKQWENEIKELQLRINPVVDSKELDTIYNKIHELEKDAENIQGKIDIEIDPYKKQELIDQYNDILNQLSKEKLKLNTGIDEDSARKLLYDLDKLRKEAKDLEALSLNPELDEAKKAEVEAQLQEIYRKISTLLLQIPVGLDEDSLRDVINQINDLTNKKEQREVKIGVKLQTNAQKFQKDIHDILKEVYKLDDIQWDFSGLSENMQKHADKLINQINRIKKAIQDLERLKEQTKDPGSRDQIQGMIDNFKKEQSVIESEANLLNRVSEEHKKHAEAIELSKQAYDMMTSSLSTISSALKELGAEEAAQVVEFVATSAQMIAQCIQNIAALQAQAIAAGTASGASLPFPANLAAIASIVATITAIFASLAKFENGGVIGGNSFTGDRLLIRANSGERILTAEQNKNFERIANGMVTPMTQNDISLMSFRVRGRDLLLVMNNELKSNRKKPID